MLKTNNFKNYKTFYFITKVFCVIYSKNLNTSPRIMFIRAAVSQGLNYQSPVWAGSITKYHLYKHKRLEINAYNTAH